MDNLPSLPVPLPEDVIGRIVDLTRHAGEIARRNFNEQDKWDATAFGTLLWRMVWNHVDDGLRENRVHTWREENSLRFDLDGYECSIYSGGHGLRWDIHSYDFARTNKRRQAANPDQSQLFDLDVVKPVSVADPTKLKKITFVYCGDPTLGLVALYVGSPIKANATYQWGWVETLYRHTEPVGSGVLGAQEYTGFAELPEEVVSVDLIATEDEVKGDGAAG